MPPIKSCGEERERTEGKLKFQSLAVDGGTETLLAQSVLMAEDIGRKLMHRTILDSFILLVSSSAGEYDIMSRVRF